MTEEMLNPLAPVTCHHARSRSRLEAAVPEAFQTEALLERIAAYWDARASAFLETRMQEFESPRSALWLEEITPALPKSNRPLRVLDAGTGTGYLALLLARLGHYVTGIDLSGRMIQEARAVAEFLAIPAAFRMMNAQETAFESESFDAIVTRNLVWTLPDPLGAYREWLRILRPGGTLIVFDADYGEVSFSKQTRELEAGEVRNAHEAIGETLLSECDAIREALPISAKRRPAWDAKALDSAGFEDIRSDLSLSDRIYREEDASWNPVPMFKLTARKPRL